MGMLAKAKGAGGRGHRRESGYTGEQAREHGDATAVKLLAAGLQAAGLKEADLAALPKGDWRKRVIGRLIRRHTTVPLGWVAERLAMGVPTRVSALLRGEPSLPAWGADWMAARKLLGELEEKYKNLD